MSHLFGMHATTVESVWVGGSIQTVQIHHCFLTESKCLSMLSLVAITFSTGDQDLEEKWVLISECVLNLIL